MISASLIRQIPGILGPGLDKAGKVPSLLTHSEDTVAEVDEVKSTVASVAVGQVKMTDHELVCAIPLAVHFLVSLFKKHWQTIRALNIRGTVGRALCLY